MMTADANNANSTNGNGTMTDPKLDLDDDLPLAAQLNGATAGVVRSPRKDEKVVKTEIGMELDDDAPLAAQLSAKIPPSSTPTKPAAQSSATTGASSNGGSATKKSPKKEHFSDSDDEPWGAKVKKSGGSTSTKPKKRRRKDESDEDEDEDFDDGDSDDDRGKKRKKPTPQKAKSSKDKKSKEDSKHKKTTKGGESSRAKKSAEDEEDVWEWWKEERKPAGVKWNSLTHKGPVFAPPYEPLPKNVHFKYNGEVMKLSPGAEEVATFYGRMLDHEYTTKDEFNDNFFKDWRKMMTLAEREKITDLKKCDFRAMHAYFLAQSEARKAMTKEEKAKIKEEKDKETKIYGFAHIDGHKQKIANFRIEPPGLFRGRGGHPKMGRLKRRVQPEDIIINCSKGAEIPKPPDGHKWKEVRHDNTVTWLSSWTENVLGQNKYIMFNPSSKIKGEKDYEKYETARKLKSKIGDIRDTYRADWKNREMRIRQRAVALYFIDKLALRAGNEKDVDEAADTVGCCSLRVEHIKLHEKHEDKESVVEFDFLGKDSIRYHNYVQVERRVFKNLTLFMENKEPGDDLFDRLDTSTLNAHLQQLMPGLTVKVFRTYNASVTLQDQLEKLTTRSDTVHAKLLSYNRANRQVAILCNHQRAVPKTHEKSMENLENKIKEKKQELKTAKDELKKARGSAHDKAAKKVERVKEQLRRLKIQRTDKDENKQIALSTSKLNYLDPRITVAWCRKNDVPIEKVFNKTHRAKFRWAIDMATADFVF